MNLLAQIPQVVIFVGITAILVACDLLIWKFLSWLNGWSSLARRFRHAGRFEGTLYRFRTLEIKWMGLAGGIHIGTNDEGFYLVPFWFFRPFHKPLLIPWEEIQAREVRGEVHGLSIRNGCELRIRSFPDIPLFLYRARSEKIVDDLKTHVEIQPAEESPGEFLP